MTIVKFLLIRYNYIDNAMKKTINFGCSLLLLTLVTINKSYSAGFAVDSHSASGLATSYAGSVTGSHDISDSFFNPAVFADVNKRELVLSATYVDISIDDDNVNSTYASNSNSVSGSRNDDAGVDAIIPAFFFATPINENTTFGISTVTPFGLATSYNPNGQQRYYAVDSEIQSVNINPSIAHKLTERLSIGAGLQAQYIKATLTSVVDVGGLFFSSPGTRDAMGKVKGDDWGYGFNLGAKYQANDKLAIGLGYRSRIKHKLEGKTQIQSAAIGNPTSDFNAPLTTPENVTLGFQYIANSISTFFSDVSWTRWSRVKSLNVNAIENSSLSTNTLFELKDSFRYSLGAKFGIVNPK